MSDRSVVGLFINPAHQSRMMPAKYASILMDIKISSSVSRCDWDSVLSCMHIVYRKEIGVDCDSLSAIVIDVIRGSGV